jgi:hypothetical protein
VLSICHDPPGLAVLTPSYRAWFERLVERYESGRYVIIVTRENVGDFWTAYDMVKTRTYRRVRP